MVKLHALLASALAALAAAVACSGDDDEGAENGGRDGDGSGGISLIGAAGSSGRSSATVLGAGAGNCEIVPDEEGCVGSGYEGESVPLDIYLMFDVSGSMVSCIDPPKEESRCPDPESPATRINAIRDATRRFLEDRASAGISVGLGYFGFQDYGSTTCDPADYSDPAVAMGMLPEHAGVIVESLESQSPTGETPTGAAIRGACEYSTTWQRQHPSHKVVQLFITDGNPEAPVTCDQFGGSCCPTLEDAAAAAEECLEADPGIQTYVLGVGPFLENLNEVAVAGGTKQAYLVSSEEDAAEQVLDALNAIRRDAAIPCDLTLPEPPRGETLRWDKVNVIHADPTCDGTVFGYVTAGAECGERGGWYYDDPEDPTTIHLCPTSCELVGIPGSELLVSIGCRTVVEIY